ncbi:MAG: SRPBCC family protein [Acidimicrobiales bacterium]
MGFEITTNIKASPEVVWAVLTDVERWPEWTPSMTKVTRLTGGPFVEGSQVRIKQPRLRTMVWTVTELTPGRSFVWEAKGPGLTLVAGHHLANEEEGAVQVTLAIEHRGLVGWLLAPLTSRLVERNVQIEAEGLKRQSEAG